MKSRASCMGLRRGGHLARNRPTIAPLSPALARPSLRGQIDTRPLARTFAHFRDRFSSLTGPPRRLEKNDNCFTVSNKSGHSAMVSGHMGAPEPIARRSPRGNIARFATYAEHSARRTYSKSAHLRTSRWKRRADNGRVQHSTRARARAQTYEAAAPARAQHATRTRAGNDNEHPRACALKALFSDAEGETMVH